jgi:hypothetical protein
MKSPKLKYRYAEGVGDIVACTLHSKLFGWLTKLLTGKDKPCQMCSKRAYAMNVLFPIKVWRLYFKTHEEFSKAFTEENIRYDQQLKPISIKNQKLPKIEDDLGDYKLYSKTETKLGEYLVRVLMYTKK